MPVLTGQKKQIFYTGLVYLLVCFMTAGVTAFLTKEKKDEVKEVSEKHYHPPERSSSASHAVPALSLVPLQSVPSEVPDTSDAGINYRIYTDYMSIQP